MVPDGRMVVLSGGVGGAKLVLGLAHCLPPDRLLVIANTADDFCHLGMHVSPDIDTVVYTLAGLADNERGWGLAGETWNFMKAIERLGYETWFNIGDQDLATHVSRTRRMRAGETLTDVTRALSRSFGVKTPILPMTDDPVATFVDTDSGRMAFQHYFVRERCEPKVKGFHFDGLASAAINPAIANAAATGTIGAVIIAPSNPFVSVDPILGVPGMRETLAAVPGPRIAVSPIVGGAAIKGPAAKMMRELDMPATALAVAQHYSGFLDAMVIDEQDQDQEADIRGLGLDVLVTRTVMQSLDDRKALARDCLHLAAAIAQR